MTAKQLKNQKEAASYIGVSDTTLRGYMKAGRIKYIKNSSGVYYSLIELDKLKKELEDKKPKKAGAVKVVGGIGNAKQKEAETIPEAKPEPKEAEELSEIEELLSRTLSEEERILREKRKQFQYILDRTPPKSWVKQLEGENTSEGKPVFDLPIEKVELMLTRIFSDWRTEITDVKQLFKECVTVTVDLHYLDVFGVWRKRSGVGAVHVGGEANAKTAVPVAKALAVKNAAKEIGRIFGRDLNRNITEVALEVKKSSIVVEYLERIKSAKDWEELERLKPKVLEIGNEELITAYNSREFDFE